MKKYFVFILALLYASLILTACGDVAKSNDTAQADQSGAQSVSDSDGAAPEKKEPEKRVAKDDAQMQTDDPTMNAMKMNVQIGTYNFTAALENNDAVRELTEMMREGPVTIQMSDYSGFEKVGPLGRSLTTSNSQTTTEAGDIVLYNGNNIVMFYGSNSWSYTRIGRIDDLTEWTTALGGGDITAIFTLME